MKAKKTSEDFRSNCPISSVLDLFGDKWSLIIIRELAYYGVRSFKDFSNIPEKISSARLADRLSKLEGLAVLSKTKHPTNKKVFLYKLTPKGLDLLPILMEYVRWSAKYLPDHISDESKKLVVDLENNPDEVIQRIRNKHS